MTPNVVNYARHPPDLSDENGRRAISVLGPDFRNSLPTTV